MKKRYLVTSPPPTTNGDLHLGHLSGPYLGADVFSRAQRLFGHQVAFISSTDDHQSFVVTKAKEEKRKPEVVIDDYTKRIKNTFSAANIKMDCFTSPRRSSHIKKVQEFFLKLYEQGKFKVVNEESYFCKECDRYLFEAHIKGDCPNCHTSCGGNYCEACGHPNDPLDLGDARCAHCQTKPGTRSLQRIVMPLEEYRGALETYYEQHSSNWRTHLREYIATLMNKKLPDVPITNYYEWGVPVPLPEFQGQVLNVWFEMVPGHMETTATWLTEQRIKKDWWTKDSPTQIVQFLGFDNSFYYAVLHPALLLAAGEYQLAETFITNKFYLLDHEKFSTSRGHAIWGIEFLETEPSDWVRYYLALTGPEKQQANFSIDQYREITNNRNACWQSFIKDAVKLSALKNVVSRSTGEAEQLVEDYERRFIDCFSLDSFSMNHAAELLHNFVEASDELITRTENQSDSIYILRAFSIFVSPIMPKLSQSIWSFVKGNSSDLNWADLHDNYNQESDYSKVKEINEYLKSDFTPLHNDERAFSHD